MTVTVRKIILILLLFFFISEILVMISYVDGSNPGYTVSYTAPPDGVPSAHIVFTGDTSGKTGVAGCERLGSLSRRATILKGFHDYLYVDFGNIATDSPRFNRPALPLLEEALRAMRLKVLNLTRRDFVKFSEVDFQPLAITLVSANLEIEAPTGFRNAVKRYLLLPLYLSSTNGTSRVTVGLTGVTGDERVLHTGDIRFKVSGAVESLRRVMPGLNKADFKVLLFNDSFLELETILKHPGISFDLVIASSSLPGHVNRMIRVHGTPIVFSDEDGRSIGHVTISGRKKRLAVEYEALVPGLGAREDSRVKSLVKTMKLRMHQRSGSSDEGV
jgi:hypothetical protein